MFNTNLYTKLEVLGKSRHFIPTNLYWVSREHSTLFYFIRTTDLVSSHLEVSTLKTEKSKWSERYSRPKYRLSEVRTPDPWSLGIMYTPSGTYKQKKVMTYFTRHTLFPGYPWVGRFLLDEIPGRIPRPVILWVRTGMVLKQAPNGYQSDLKCFFSRKLNTKTGNLENRSLSVWTGWSDIFFE